MCHRAACYSTEQPWPPVEGECASVRNVSTCKEIVPPRSSSMSVCVWPQQQYHRSGACLLGSTLLPLMFLGSSLLCRRLHLDSTVHGSRLCEVGRRSQRQMIVTVCGGTSTNTKHFPSAVCAELLISKWPHTRRDTHPLTHSLPSVGATVTGQPKPLLHTQRNKK
jgi:hypothetical protein